MGILDKFNTWAEEAEKKAEERESKIIKPKHSGGELTIRDADSLSAALVEAERTIRTFVGKHRDFAIYQSHAEGVMKASDCKWNVTIGYVVRPIDG